MTTRVVLFDLGGVALDIDFDRALAAWSPYSRLPLARLRETFHFDEPYLRHEVGQLQSEDYFAHLRELLALDCDLDAVRAGFNAILVAEIAETLQLVDAARAKVACHAISNTNAAHVAEMERAFPRLLKHFDRVFVSHEIGHRKPHPQAFQHVLQEIGVPAAQVLLFDDLQANVEAARACGLQAVLVRSPADIRVALAERGLLERA
jgi:putative hydrolase of the HAD superfamily